VGHIYLKSKLEPQEIERFALNLISHANIPMVILPKGNDRNKTVGIWTENGHFIIPDQANEIFDADAPFFSEMVQDFINACHHTDSGDLIICGRQVKNNTYYTFAIENGSHGGISTEEAEGFALLPKNMSVGRGNKKYVRPLDLRAGAFELLGAKTEEHDKTYIHPLRGDKVLRIMTYNVHGCVGMDGRLSPRRVAEVISQYEPDIVALQELDVGRLRSGREDQAMLIAERLNMEHYFHASMRVAEESFGNAILSSYPMKLIKKGSLSKLQRFSSLESRGALWVQVEFNTLLIQIINTHLGLNSQERLMQSRELFSKSWLRNPQCIEPVILCGDFNAIPGSKVFKLIHNNLASVQAKAKRRQRRRTWFGRYPFACLDHIFASSVFEVVSVEVCDSYLARLASDHRPLLADLKMP
jgi:endonuclease/exonuclease/phosphatase family metal-dependent hydrolase